MAEGFYSSDCDCSDNEKESGAAEGEEVFQLQEKIYYYSSEREAMWKKRWFLRNTNGLEDCVVRRAKFNEIDRDKMGWDKDIIPQFDEKWKSHDKEYVVRVLLLFEHEHYSEDAIEWIQRKGQPGPRTRTIVSQRFRDERCAIMVLRHIVDLIKHRSELVSLIEAVGVEYPELADDGKVGYDDVPDIKKRIDSTISDYNVKMERQEKDLQMEEIRNERKKKMKMDEEKK